MMNNSEALEVCVKLYMREFTPTISRISVDVLNKDVDLTVAPSELEKASFLEVVMRLLTREMTKDKNEELLRFGEDDIIEKYFKEHNIQCIEDIHQSDNTCEWAMNMLGELFELREYFKHKSQS